MSGRRRNQNQTGINSIFFISFSLSLSQNHSNGWFSCVIINLWQFDLKRKLFSISYRMGEAIQFIEDFDSQFHWEFQRGIVRWFLWCSLRTLWTMAKKFRIEWRLERKSVLSLFYAAVKLTHLLSILFARLILSFIQSIKRLDIFSSMQAKYLSFNKCIFA